MIDFSLITASIPQLLRGTLISCQVAFISILMGFVLGTLLGIGQTLGSRLIKAFIFAYVTVIRGTPMIVQIFFIFYVLPQFGIVIPPFWAASIAIGLNSCAYISQTLQSGINSVSHGQIEAARTLGFSGVSTMWHIILPQAFRTVMPSLGNEIITLVKDSSLASLIGVMELTKEASIIRSHTYDPFSVLLVVALIYLLITSTLSYLLKKLNQRLGGHVHVKSLKFN